MNKREIVFISVILLLACFLRFWKLGEVPTGVTHDEMGYIYNAYSIAKTGKNVFGESFPFLTWMVSRGFPFLPVPIYFAAPVFWILPLSAMSGRLLPAILGLSDVFLIYILVKQLFKHTNLALLSSLFLAISPWHLHFSRSAYDTNYSLFFFLLGIAIFLYEVKKKRLPVFSTLSFLLAIFSYRGMNVLFPPLAVSLLLYSIFALKIAKRQIVAFVIGALCVASILLVVIGIYGKPYIAEANIFASPKMTEDIDTQIREAQGPLGIRRLYLNKAMYIANTLRENYIRGYSPEFLFLYTEPSKIYAIWSRGRIYFLDFIFIVLGIIYLYKLEKRSALFVTALLLIGGLPGMLGGFPYSARNLFMAAIFPVFVAGGVLYLYYLFRSRLRLVIAACIFLSYLYVFGGYIFDYYGRYALYSSEAWVKSLREVSNLVDERKPNFDRVVVGTTSFGDFVQYAFYAKVSPLRVQKAWQERKETSSGPTFLVDNIEFQQGCLTKDQNPLTYQSLESILYIVHEDCHKDATASAVIRDYQRNTVWKIYEIHRRTP